MQRKKNPAGKLVCLPHEWRSQKQIASFFGQLSSRQKHMYTQISTPGTTELEKDMWHSESDRQQVRNAVFGKLDLVHPLMYLQHNICDLARRSKLNQLTLNDLEKICIEYEVQPCGPKSRKIGFI